MLSLLVAQLSLWPEFLDLLFGSGGCGGFCTTWDTMLLEVPPQFFCLPIGLFFSSNLNPWFLSSLMMAEVVTPWGKGCSYWLPVATAIRSRV